MMHYNQHFSYNKKLGAFQYDSELASITGGQETLNGSTMPVVAKF
jgi:hypothetical protein